MSAPVELVSAVREIETHAAQGGWDQPAQLFALVETADLVRREPALAQSLGLAQNGSSASLTPVQQEALPAESSLEEVLAVLGWPQEVSGCAVVVERLVLPPDAVQTMPEDPAEVAAYAAQHPDRQEVRIVAAATRDGATYCALRMREHDDDASVLTGPDLVPRLLELLAATFAEVDQDVGETG
ncbi:MAG: PPA1309 family protein [Actinomycetota bacterium]|nr:PPA1309 family protein [Actinomycetota bacterium]